MPLRSYDPKSPSPRFALKISMNAPKSRRLGGEDGEREQ